MDKKDTGSPVWPASLIQTTEDATKAVSSVRSPRPSVVFSSKEESSNSQLQKLQRQVTKVLKGFSSPPQDKRKMYNPEILTSQKRQWARFQLQSLDQRPIKEPSKIFESLVVVGLPPSSDVKALETHLVEKKSDGSRRLKVLLNNRDSVHKDVNLEPQVLFVYPPEKQLPLKYKDLLSFCFPAGLEVHAVERTPSMSELNEILLGQEHLKQSDLSFVFRLQVADDSTLYGCCVLVEEIVQKPSKLISMIHEEKNCFPRFSRLIITAPRCYCLITRLPFFDLHFGVLKSIFTEERLQLLKEDSDILNLATSKGYPDVNGLDEALENCELIEGTTEPFDAQAMISDSLSSVAKIGNESVQDNEISNDEFCGGTIGSNISLLYNLGTKKCSSESKCPMDLINGHHSDTSRINHTPEKQLSEAVLPLLRYHHYESSESSSWSEMDENEVEEPSSSGREESNDHNDVLAWAKANNHGSLQIVCEYHKLCCPKRGSKIIFRPLEHLHPLDFHRPGETVLHIAGSTVDLRSCSTSLEVSEAHNALLVEEEATALSVWAVACICGNLRLENVLMMFAGALLEKQIVVVCTNLGILCASVLSVIPLIRPYQWQSLLMPVLPNDMIDFLDAPVPYIVGIKDKTTEVQSRSGNTIFIDANKNQVKSPSIPKLPQHKELISRLSPYHATLVGESYLARKRPVYEYTDTQAEAAKGFLAVLRSYLDSLCSNLRSHTITNVQTNDDKVSLLLKESFIDSFASRDQPFMKLFVDTQLFSMHTDLVLSFYQKD